MESCYVSLYHLWADWPKDSVLRPAIVNDKGPLHDAVGHLTYHQLDALVQQIGDTISNYPGHNSVCT